MNVAEHTRLKGGLITATEQAEAEGKNRFQTATIDTEDIRNHSRYEGRSYGIGISGSMGGGEGRQQIGGQKLTAYGDNTVTRTDNGDTTRQGRASVSAQIGFGRDSDSRESTTPSGIGTRNLTVTADPAAAATLYTDIRTETAAVSSGRLNNTFDKERVQKELDIQREVTQQFGSNIGYVKSRVNQRIEGLKAAREAGRISQEEYDKQTAKLEMAKLLTDSVAMGLMTPSNSLGGTLLTAASPIASREIGAYFKTVDPQTGKDKQGTPAHIMAHTVWNAAVAYATGNNAGTAALAAGGSETVTPILSNWLFKEKDPSKLTEDQKETLATINRLLGSGIGAAGGNADNALSDGLIARNVAEQNNMTRAGKGVVVPLFGALYCALDKHCGSVTDTFTGMMSEQIKSAQEEREKLFPILNDGKGGGEKAQVPKHPVSRSATGAPMPPDDEDDKNLSISEQKEIRSLNKRIREHQEKIDKFRKNPTIRPGMENLPKDVIKAAQERRILHLEREIKAFQTRIDVLKGRAK
ncbi:VENN motif pre-toxin domain-containing protein [Neisseria weaveri]|uniref:Putative hemagglutinin n=4 Tax=Neisseria weaveri TaxID=28091 RepID=A0A448VH06_9NEIS|nr:VENN motif pre-toxin domain-containing protein [Neisseria weaveri]VEJ49049.1 putative hemagglutinin [Neisseria weaveri]